MFEKKVRGSTPHATCMLPWVNTAGVYIIHVRLYFQKPSTCIYKICSYKADYFVNINNSFENLNKSYITLIPINQMSQCPLTRVSEWAAHVFCKHPLYH